jgi:diaminohydroxyphosphoribosylaminopyrimidine deaminase/5-amino-6-(5-phosphoribosylamino)uracil reductase
VLAATGEVVGEGAHVAAGLPHAEVVALRAAGGRAAGGTLVVTLEPCAHEGRTPPCTEAILAAGVARVVFGAEDPDDRVHGRGAARLRRAGVEVVGGVRAVEVEAADPGYFHHRRTGRPRVTLKAALTLDGQSAAADGTSRWITGEEARSDGHRLRAEADAVMVGAGTVLADDPLLDVRLPAYTGPQPRPVVVAGRRPLPPSARVLARGAVVLAAEPLDLGPHVEIVVAPGAAGSVDLAAGLGRLGELGLVDVLVEGGARLAAGLWQEGLVDQGVFYLAGLVAGGAGIGAFRRVFATLGEARRVTVQAVHRIGPDLRIEWKV